MSSDPLERKLSLDDDIEEEEDHSKRIRLSTEKYDEQQNSNVICTILQKLQYAMKEHDTLQIPRQYCTISSNCNFPCIPLSNYNEEGDRKNDTSKCRLSESNRLALTRTKDTFVNQTLTPIPYPERVQCGPGGIDTSLHPCQLQKNAGSPVVQVVSFGLFDRISVTRCPSLVLENQVKTIGSLSENHDRILLAPVGFQSRFRCVHPIPLYSLIPHYHHSITTATSGEESKTALKSNKVSEFWLIEFYCR